MVVVKYILEWISPVNNLNAEGFELSAAQSMAKPSARPCALMVYLGVLVRFLSMV